jgi:hypothetical protein
MTRFSRARMGVFSGVILTARAVHRRSVFDIERCGCFRFLSVLFGDVRGAFGVRLVGAAQARQTGA